MRRGPGERNQAVGRWRPITRRIGAALVLWWAVAGMAAAPFQARAAQAEPPTSTADVPLGDRAYRDLAVLGETGLLGPDAPSGGAQPASRYEMALWIAEALDTLHAELFGSPAPHLAPADEVRARLNGLASEISRVAAVVDEADLASFTIRGRDPAKSQEETSSGKANNGRGALAADLRRIAAHFTALHAEAATATTPEAFRHIDRRIDTLQQMLASVKEAVARALPEDVATHLWEKMQPSFQQGIFRRIAERATDFTLQATPLDSSALLAGKRTQQVEAAAKALSHLAQEFRSEMIALGRWPPPPASTLRLEASPLAAAEPEWTDVRASAPDWSAQHRATTPLRPNVPQSAPLRVLPNPDLTPGKSPEAVLSELHVGGATAEVRASYGGAALDLDALRQIDAGEPPAFGLRGTYSLSSRATVRGGYQVRPTLSGDHLTGLSAQAGAGVEYRLGGRTSLTAAYDVPLSGSPGGGDLLDGTAGIGLRYQVDQDAAVVAAYRLIDFTDAGALRSDLGARLSLRF